MVSANPTLGPSKGPVAPHETKTNHGAYGNSNRIISNLNWLVVEQTPLKNDGVRQLGL